MTPLKWYEEITFAFTFTPFRWKLQAAYEPMWGSAHLYVGPFWIGVGFPTANSFKQA